jgi:hypothetical protein
VLAAFESSFFIAFGVYRWWSRTRAASITVGLARLAGEELEIAIVNTEGFSFATLRETYIFGSQSAIEHGGGQADASSKCCK